MSHKLTYSGTKGSWKGQNVESTLRFNTFFCSLWINRSFKLMNK